MSTARLPKRGSAELRTRPTVAPAAATHAVDPQLVENTRDDIRELLDEIARLARRPLAPEEFGSEVVQRAVAALAAIGGIFWLVNEKGDWAPAAQWNVPPELLSDQAAGNHHRQLVTRVAASGKGALVPPRTESREAGQGGNPTDNLLVLGPVRLDQESVGLIEILQRPGGNVATQRGYLRFVAQVCDLAGDFFGRLRVHQCLAREQQTVRWDQFVCAVHASLDVRETAFTIVNDARPLLACERVTLALQRGSRLRIEAVSGLDTVHPRSTEVDLLSRLAAMVVASGEPLWYEGSAGPQPGRGAGRGSGASETERPPQIAQALEQYVDHAHSRAIAILPLAEAAPSDSHASRPLGALILERRNEGRLDGAFRQQAVQVSQHSRLALANAVNHQSLFLLPLWRALGRAGWLVRARTLPKTLLVAGLLGAMLAALVGVRADFDLGARGKLLPAVRREIFAPADGVVVQVPVDYGTKVRKGQPVAVLRNTELEIKITELVGRGLTTEKQIREKEHTLLKNPQLTDAEQESLNGELLQLRQVAESTAQQLALYRHKEQQLVVKSDLTGEVATWQVADRLRQRPVDRGQVLMSVADPEQAWELELYVRERRMGHVIRAWQETGEELEVTYSLSTHPGSEFKGRVLEIQRSAEVRGEEGNTVLVRVAIDKQALPELTSDATVTARLHCGRRSLGFVWFHELLETVHAQLLFWF